MEEDKVFIAAAGTAVHVDDGVDSYTSVIAVGYDGGITAMVQQVAEDGTLIDDVDPVEVDAGRVHKVDEEGNLQEDSLLALFEKQVTDVTGISGTETGRTVRSWARGQYPTGSGPVEG